MTNRASIQTETSLNRTQCIGRWIVVNFLAGLIVGTLENNGLQFLATLIFSGAIVGSLQWMFLRRIVQQTRWWALASAIGWILGSLAMIQTGFLYAPIVTLLQNAELWEVFWLNLLTAPIPILGMALGQGLVLQQNKHLPTRDIWLWMAASLVGGMLQGGFGAAFCAVLCPYLPPIGISNGLAWAFYGIVTGFVLLRLLNSSKNGP